MSYASGTTHYNLPQTVGSDKRDWTDTNQAFSDIDAAIYGAAQGASAATSAIETINGEIETITGKQAVDEGNISTLAGKVSTLESTVGTQAAAIADVRQDLQDNIESKREASATSTHAYNIGDTFYYNDVLYKATAQIAIGGTIVPSTNCTAVTVMSELAAINPDKGYVEVTGDGVKTYGTLFDELHALVDLTKISGASRLSYLDPSGTMYNYCLNYSIDGDINFSISITTATDVNNTGITLKASGSDYYKVQTSTSATTITSLATVAGGNGRKIRLTY